MKWSSHKVLWTYSNRERKKWENKYHINFIFLSRSSNKMNFAIKIYSSII